MVGNQFVPFRRGVGRPRSLYGPRRPGGGFYKKRPTRMGPATGAGRRLARRTAARTQLRRKRPNQLARTVVKSQQGGLPSLSRFGLVSPASSRVRTMKKVGAANYYTTNAAAHITTEEGFQNGSVYDYNSIADLKQIATYVPNSLDSPQSGTTQPYKQYVLESAIGEYMITNATNATALIDIYDIVRLRDNGDPLNGQSGAFNATQNPLKAWQQGVLDENGGLLSQSYQNLNSLPTDSRLFKDWFRIKRRSHIGLAVGATHRHQVWLKPNRLVDTALLEYVGGDMAKLAVYTMIVFWGQPVTSKSTVTEPPTYATTTAKIALDIVRTVRYKYTWVADNTNNYYFTDNMVSLVADDEVLFNSASGLKDFVDTTIP